MSLLSRSAAAGLSLTAVLLTGAEPSRTAELRVCADPNNLPFSNARAEGFENRIAALLARDLGTTVHYTWWAERRGFIRKTLGAHRCDVVMGIPAVSDRVLATRPYYTSSYVFLTRVADHRHIETLDDPVLRRLKIGVHLIGEDYNNPPPVQALARRGIVRNVVGYSIYGDYSRPNPPSDLVHAVARGEIDVAIIWGPFAGYFAHRESVPLEMKRVLPAIDSPGLPFTFAIALGVRSDDATLRARLDAALDRHRVEIGRILDSYGIPRVKETSLVTCRPGPRRGSCV
jgi:mxaJ protein